ncbi:TadE/TadG family type IV pilus assembly protein [Streptomyces sp. NPDC001941]|uniref:TadE/TadG family type IV pilus assembly protein n=1 Tax=Streptomyces sp. NPDC001941 TaxID=3154659 RepID=UPI003318150D
MVNRKRTRDRGQVALEYAGFLPLLLIVAFLAIQLGVAVYAVSQANTAARAGARAATSDYGHGNGEREARAAVSDWLQDDWDDWRYVPGPAYREFTATVTLKIPSLVPGIDDWGHVSRSVTMPAGNPF